MSKSRPIFCTHPTTLKTARERNAAASHYAILSGKELPALERERTYTRHDELTSEHQHQVRVVAWWDKIGSRQFGLPTYALFAVPNAAKRSPQLGAYMKAEGLRAGIPDLILAVPRQGKPGMLLELKREDGRLSESQIDVQAWLILQGYEVKTCKGADLAIYEITRYLA